MAGNLRPANSTVKFDVISPWGASILAALTVVAKTMNCDLTITCGTEAHAPGTPHSVGSAYDLRVKDLSEAQILTLVNKARAILGDGYTVLYEVPKLPNGVLASLAYVNTKATAPHVHIQKAKHP